jgi:hypothetical protein
MPHGYFGAWGAGTAKEQESSIRQGGMRKMFHGMPSRESGLHNSS